MGLPRTGPGQYPDPSYSQTRYPFLSDMWVDRLDQAQARIAALEEEKATMMQGYHVERSEYEGQRLESDQRQFEEWSYTMQSMRQRVEELAKQNQDLTA